jgi:hypothetical protein
MKIKYLRLLVYIFIGLFEFYFTEQIMKSDREENEILLRKNKKIQGEMNIDGEMYNTICDCDPVLENDINVKQKCNADKLSIHLQREGQGATLAEVESLIGNFEELNFFYIPNTSFKCLDGRNTRAVLGTPGGDAGEFIIALNVYEEFLKTEHKLSQNEIEKILTLYLEILPYDKFYMCTDDIAVSHLESELSVIIF